MNNRMFVCIIIVTEILFGLKIGDLITNQRLLFYLITVRGQDANLPDRNWHVESHQHYKDDVNIKLYKENEGRYDSRVNLGWVERPV